MIQEDVTRKCYIRYDPGPMTQLKPMAKLLYPIGSLYTFWEWILDPIRFMELNVLKCLLNLPTYLNVLKNIKEAWNYIVGARILVDPDTILGLRSGFLLDLAFTYQFCFVHPCR